MRRRRYLPAWMLVVLRPAFRYSGSRDAWILRVVGHRFGPVLKLDEEPHPFARRAGAFAAYTILAVALGALGWMVWYETR